MGVRGEGSGGQGGGKWGKRGREVGVRGEGGMPTTPVHPLSQCYIDDFGYSMFGLGYGWRHVIMYAG